MKIITFPIHQNYIDSSKPIKVIKMPKINIQKDDNKNNHTNRKSKIIIISISILLLLGIIIFISLWFTIISPQKKDNYKIIDTTEITDSSDINEHIIISVKDLNFNEIESLLESKKIKKNLNLLNETKDKINNLINFCENSNLEKNKINQTVIFPDFLKNVTKPALKIAKSDFEFYKRKNEELMMGVNNFINNISKSLKNLTFPLSNIKNEIDGLFFRYEKTLKNLCIPLILKQKQLYIMNNASNINTNENKKRILNLDNQIEEYKNETNNLNELYNELFEYISEETQIIEDEIKKIPNLNLDIHNRIENGISKYNEVTNGITETDDIQYIHNNLIEIKASFISTKNYLYDKKNNLEERINNHENETRNTTFDSEDFEIRSDKIIENINEKGNIIKNDIISSNENKNIIEIRELEASSILSEYIIKSINITHKMITDITVESDEEEINECYSNIVDVEEKTSLDLLFVMDITGSMQDYLEQAKQNVINMINRIIEECPGIDINLGFIGYRDIIETNNKDYVDIDFTKDYQSIKDTIKYVIASGGDGDGPEDVAWAMEMALNKDWKSNARFITFVADYPCHGSKYHNISTDKYLNPPENRRDIEELIKELAANNISLFCMKITQYTDIMFNIFSNIYKNYINCEFKVVPMNSEKSLDDFVVNSAVDVYVSQRNMDN